MSQASSSPPTCHRHPGAAVGRAHHTLGPRAKPGCGYTLPKKGVMPVRRGLLRLGSAKRDLSADRAGKAPATATFPPLGPCWRSGRGIQLQEPAVRIRHRLHGPELGSSAGIAGPLASRKVRAQRRLDSKRGRLEPPCPALRTGPAPSTQGPGHRPAPPNARPCSTLRKAPPRPTQDPVPWASAGTAQPLLLACPTDGVAGGAGGGPS